MIGLEGRNVVFIPESADRLFFAAAAIALNQHVLSPGALLSYDPRITPKIVADLPMDRVQRIPLNSPLELAITLSPPVISFAPMSQRDPRWAKRRLGEGGETIGASGCFVTSLAMMLQDVYGVAIRPDALADVMRLMGDCFNGDYLDWIATIRHLSRLKDPLRQNSLFEPGNIRMRLDQGHKIIVTNPRVSHFAYLMCVVGDKFRVADPIAGITEWKSVGGIRSAKLCGPEPGDGPFALFVCGYGL